MDNGPSVLERLAYFVGTWHGDGTFLDSPLGPGFPQHHLRVEGSYLSEHWLVQRFVWIEGPATSPEPKASGGRGSSLQVAMRVWGYDPAEQKIVSEWFDSKGRRATVTSPGWDGDRLVTTSTMQFGDHEVELRETFIRTNDNEWRHRGDINAGDGWTQLDEQILRRVPPAGS